MTERLETGERHHETKSVLLEAARLIAQPDMLLTNLQQLYRELQTELGKLHIKMGKSVNGEPIIKIPEQPSEDLKTLAQQVTALNSEILLLKSRNNQASPVLPGVPDYKDGYF